MGRLVRGVNQALLLQYYFFILSEIDALRKVKGKKNPIWIRMGGYLEKERVSEWVVGKREYCKVILDVFIGAFAFFWVIIKFALSVICLAD